MVLIAITPTWICIITPAALSGQLSFMTLVTDSDPRRRDTGVRQRNSWLLENNWFSGKTAQVFLHNWRIKAVHAQTSTMKTTLYTKAAQNEVIREQFLWQNVSGSKVQSYPISSFTSMLDVRLATGLRLVLESVALTQQLWENQYEYSTLWGSVSSYLLASYLKCTESQS